MNRYHILFNNLLLKKEGCFVPFVVLGDPSIKVSLKIIDNLIISGADALELGIPFSDPMADGAIIQNANLRAFQSGISVSKCFQMLNIIRKKYPMIPIGLLVYANIVFCSGIENFYFKCAINDIDSVLIADVPIEESNIFIKSAKRSKISPIFICPPNVNNDILKKINMYSHSYIYLLSRTGVTGHTNKNHIGLSHLIEKFKSYKSVPLLRGFGISEPSEIKNIIQSGVLGVICGSIIIEKIEKYYTDNNLMQQKIKNLVTSLKQATIL